MVKLFLPYPLHAKLYLLSATVSSADARLQAAKIVASRAGVKGVETTDLKVKAS